MELWRPTDAELRTFWATSMTPQYVLPRLTPGSVNMVSLSVGLGKSQLADAMMLSELVRDEYDLIIYSAAQTKILAERPQAIVQRPETRVLRPRPSHLCGPLDEEWQRLEARGCSAFAKSSLCKICLHGGDCDWLAQFQGLQLCDTIMSTQAYLRCAPLVMTQRIRSARKPLVILDEDLVLTQPFKHRLDADDLEHHRSLVAEALEQAGSPGEMRILQSHAATVEALLEPRVGLRGLRPPRIIPPRIAAEIQEEGLSQYGDDYSYSGMSVYVGLRSKRYRTPGNSVDYIWRPWLGKATVLVLSAELDPMIIRHRLGRDVHSVFPLRYTQHQESQIFNISDHRMSAAYLPRHLPHFAVPLAQFINNEDQAGRRVLIVTRKKFLGLVCHHLNDGLARVRSSLCVVTHRVWKGDPLQVPAISYGLQGINSFAGFDTALCVGAYNIDPKALDEIINDTHRPSEALATEITYDGGARRSRVKGLAASPEIQDLAQRYLFHVEFNTANQAVGRVRHCTRPRLVIFCQQTELPYHLEEPSFERFAGFCRYFGLRTARELEVQARAACIQELKGQGLTQRKVSERLGVSLSTVKRRWHP